MRKNDPKRKLASKKMVGFPNSKKSVHTLPKTKISWTAHFTAAVWYKLGVADAVYFVTRRGKFVELVVRWGGVIIGLRHNYSVTNLFLAPRYLGINKLLTEQQTSQVIELAAGLSSRGYTWSRSHNGKYIEVDQPDVIAEKLRKLSSQDKHFAPDNYILLGADLRTEGWIEKLMPLVDPTLPTLIICEGLTGYLSEPNLTQLLQSIRNLACHFQTSTIWLDFYLKLQRRKHGRVYWAMLPAQIFWKLGRASMNMFLKNTTQIEQMLTTNGFRIQRIWSATELARLTPLDPPPYDLFYLAEIVI